MQDSASRLARISNDLGSASDLTCLKAVTELLLWCRQDRGIAAAALPLFERALTKFPYVANLAVQGIELIQGREAALRYRQAFLRDTNSALVRATVLNTTDPAEVPQLIEVLNRSADANVREAAVRLIGRLGTPAAFDTLVHALREPSLRPHAVEALSELGDIRAIPYLEALQSDTTPAWPIDNHGPMLDVSDLAIEALKKLRQRVPLPR